ncbi:MAG: hypothetical protein BM557_10535 [Flavobacterium sp. MedPE-SWcel]|uniref:zinc-dependent metalloprotease n=1 Tax=uncultured Flavobacterium sp. TaxID=165435 RepID=UPI000912DDB6|nr:zinc-dependent metalloprotease family protein [uncultured Flavobacterium sp.]OIQ15985.1 MAG: hypothetical protein BM557_10535 [Flavobacterium sp. MedPE-SWcel]
MKRILLLIVAMLTFGLSNAQSFWNTISEDRVGGLEKMDRDSYPSKSHLFTLNFEDFKTMLETAPSRENHTGLSSVIIPIPNGEGEIENFRIYEASVLHPDLAAQYPSIKSYVGQGIENPTSTVRFSTTMFGFHAMILSTKGTSYVDTYTRDLQNYIVYKKSDIQTARHFACEVIDEGHNRAAASEDEPFSVNAGDSTLRTYRLAMACTVEYANFHVNASGAVGPTTAQKKAIVLAAMNVTMTRVNGLYERDMAITMQIIPTNENIIFVDSDNLTNNNSGVLLGEIQTVINANIGVNNYDIGHVVSTGAGGVAILGSVCSSNKARGVTGRPAPVGDPFDIDYVAHEMGHQFGAEHTFNNAFQRNADTAVEPGSGTTIMAYAGISPPNVQGNSDDHFHTVSISQMTAFVNASGGACATETANGNAAPSINFLSNHTIPRTTAFILKGNGLDADASAALTYCWEQVDANGAGSTIDVTPSSFATSGPNFRSLSPSDSPNRYMPELSTVLSGNLTPTWEVVSSAARTFTFALTLRDNQVPNGGQTFRDDIAVTVVSGAGPFSVTSQNTTGITWLGNGDETITWDVAGTTGNGVNTQNVNILLSTDGGLTFDTVLASNTPNDGSEVITVPNVQNADSCRIMVEAAGNIYYAVNSRVFSIDFVNGTDDFGLESFKLYPNPNNGSFSVSFNSQVSSNVAITVHDIRGREVFSNQYKNTGLFATDVNLEDIQSGLYIVTVTDGSRRAVKKIVVQ